MKKQDKPIIGELDLIPHNPVSQHIISLVLPELTVSARSLFHFQRRFETPQEDTKYLKQLGNYLLSVFECVLENDGINESQILKKVILHSYELWDVKKYGAKEEKRNNLELAMRINKKSRDTALSLLERLGLIYNKKNGREVKYYCIDIQKAKDFAHNLVSWKWNDIGSQKQKTWEEAIKRSMTKTIYDRIAEDPELWRVASAWERESYENVDHNKAVDFFRGAYTNSIYHRECVMKRKTIRTYHPGMSDVIGFDIPEERQGDWKNYAHELLLQDRSKLKPIEIIDIPNKDKRPKLVYYSVSGSSADESGVYCSECGEKVEQEQAPLGSEAGDSEKEWLQVKVQYVLKQKRLGLSDAYTALGSKECDRELAQKLGLNNFNAYSKGRLKRKH